MREASWHPGITLHTLWVPRAEPLKKEWHSWTGLLLKPKSRVAGRAGRAGPRLRRAPPTLLCLQAQYVFLHQCILRFLQQSAAAQAQKGATYENLLMENTAATEA